MSLPNTFPNAFVLKLISALIFLPWIPQGFSRTNELKPISAETLEKKISNLKTRRNILFQLCTDESGLILGQKEQRRIRLENQTGDPLDCGAEAYALLEARLEIEKLFPATDKPICSDTQQKQYERETLKTLSKPGSCFQVPIQQYLSDHSKSLKPAWQNLSQKTPDQVSDWSVFASVETLSSTNLLAISKLPEAWSSKASVVRSILEDYVALTEGLVHETTRCALWEGEEYSSECLDEVNRWKCAPVAQREQILCGIVKTFPAGLTQAYLSGDELTPINLMVLYSPQTLHKLSQSWKEGLPKLLTTTEKLQEENIELTSETFHTLQNFLKEEPKDFLVSYTRSLGMKKSDIRNAYIERRRLSPKVESIVLDEKSQENPIAYYRSLLDEAFTLGLHSKESTQRLLARDLPTNDRLPASTP